MIELKVEKDFETYSQFLADPKATVFHSVEWLKFASESFPGSSLEVFTFLKDGKPMSVIPSLRRKVGPFRFSYSLPWGTYGSPLFLEPAGADDLWAMLSLLGTANTHRVYLVDFWNRLPQVPNFVRQELITHLIELPENYENLWEKVYDKTQRETQRQARRRDCAVHRVSSEDELKEFHTLHASLMTRKKAEAFSLDFFKRLLRELGPSGTACFYLVRVGGEPASCVVVIAGKEMAVAWIAGGDNKFLWNRPLNLMYDAVLQDLISRKVRLFNFGASPPEARGLRSFKESFGGKPYSYFVFDRKKFWLKPLLALKKRG
ncbi:MAG: GNAT family N-acetyltransferase [Candidatus Eisenbacteria bacterium]|nr:GNAT family N-acetyltransferase [Candidatus Eisenbacteria bacterium]